MQMSTFWEFILFSGRKISATVPVMRHAVRSLLEAPCSLSGRASCLLSSCRGKIHSYCFCCRVQGPAADCKMRTWPWSKRKALVPSFQNDFSWVIFNK